MIDVSVAVEWLVDEVASKAAHRFLGGSDPLIDPDFVVYETLNVLRHKYKRADIEASQLRLASQVLVGFFDRLVPASTLADQAVDLTHDLDHGVYDCAYLACAIQHRAILITADEVFAKKAIAKGSTP